MHRWFHPILGKAADEAGRTMNGKLPLIVDAFDGGPHRGRSPRRIHH